MKSIVSDIMKCKFALLLILVFAGPALGLAQAKQERAFRIRKSQFPSAALEQASPYLDGVKRVRFYQEIDSSQTYFEIKFKKDRLHYGVRYNPQGELQAVEVRISPVDVPGAAWEAIGEHLYATFGNYRIASIGQQYPRVAFASDSETFRKAFQNLLLPEIRYELTLYASKGSGKKTWEAVYDPAGLLLSLREALPPNYDHILY